MQKKNIYIKYKKKNKKNIALTPLNNNIGFFYLRSLELGFLNTTHFESIRRLYSRKVKKKVKYLFIKNTNKLPIYQKPLKVRMGSGKAKFKAWIWKFQKFQKIFEVSFYLKFFLIHKYLIKLKKKIPLKTFITQRT